MKCGDNNCSKSTRFAVVTRNARRKPIRSRVANPAIDRSGRELAYRLHPETPKGTQPPSPEPATGADISEVRMNVALKRVGLRLIIHDVYFLQKYLKAKLMTII